VTELSSRQTYVGTFFLQEYCHGTFTEIYTIKLHTHTSFIDELNRGRQSDSTIKLQFSQQGPIRFNPRVSSYNLQAVWRDEGRQLNTLPMKLKSNAPFMSSSESGSDSFSSSSDGSDNEWSMNRDLVVPSPVISSDSDDDGVSLSQHELAMKKQLADHHVAPNSTSGSDEEEEVVEEEDVEQSIEAQSGTSFESTSTAAIFSR
jgi:hypothetical protein